MLILCRHIQVYTLGRLSIDGFSSERVAQFNLEWIFCKLDSGFQSSVGFRILIAGFRIPKPRIPDARSRKFLDSGIRIPLHGATSNNMSSLVQKKHFFPSCTLFLSIASFLPGGSPYPDINARKIAQKLQEGYRMPKPKHLEIKL